jgi:hypothetical protein
MSPCPFDLGIRWKWVVSPGSCTLEEEEPVPLDRQLGGPQSWSGHFGEEKNGHLCWDLNHISVVVQPSHYTASLQPVIMTKLKGKGSKQHLFVICPVLVGSYFNDSCFGVYDVASLLPYWITLLSLFHGHDWLTAHYLCVCTLYFHMVFI